MCLLFFFLLGDRCFVWGKGTRQRERLPKLSRTQKNAHNLCIPLHGYWGSTQPVVGWHDRFCWLTMELFVYWTFSLSFSLSSPRSGTAARDIVQFVPFRDFKQVNIYTQFIYKNTNVRICRLPACPSARPPCRHPFANSSIYIHPSIHLPIHLPIHASTHSPIHPFTYPSHSPIHTSIDRLLLNSSIILELDGSFLDLRVASVC